MAVMCRVLEVSRSGYYAWHERPESEHARRDRELLPEIRRVFAENRFVYGALRVWKALKKQGVACGRGRVERLMREHDIRAKRRRRFTVTTKSDPTKTPAPNLLDRDFTAPAPNRKWCSDISFIETQEGWLYLAAILDLYSRKIVGWAMGGEIDAALVCRAWDMAVAQRQPAPGLLHHSDRGSQYTSHLFQQRLRSANAVVSMSRKGNCYDNAAMESFFGTLKTELVDRTTYRTRAEAETDIFFYIEGFYNRTRLHSTNDFVSPQDFEEAFDKQKSDSSTCPLILG